jgi:hypothetical protein
MARSVGRTALFQCKRYALLDQQTVETNPPARRSSRTHRIDAKDFHGKMEGVFGPTKG